MVGAPAAFVVGSMIEGVCRFVPGVDGSCYRRSRNVRYGSLADMLGWMKKRPLTPESRHPVLTSTSCHVAVGSSPTATTNGPRIAANVPEDMVVAAGQKLAVIRTTTSGVLHVTEVSG